jgi:hypothetical protein
MRMDTRESLRRSPAIQGRGAWRCRRKFLHFYPRGFRDEDYVDAERDYKWQSHLRWREALGRGEFSALLHADRHSEIAARAVRIEQRSQYSMLFSFEKMALRDAVKSTVALAASQKGCMSTCMAMATCDFASKLGSRSSPVYPEDRREFSPGHLSPSSVSWLSRGNTCS